MAKWTQEDILKDLRRVFEETGDLTRDSYRRKGKIATSIIDGHFKDFTNAKVLMIQQIFEEKLLKIIKTSKSLLDLEGICNMLDASPRRVKETIDVLVKRGYNIKLRNKKLVLDNVPDFNIGEQYKISMEKPKKFLEFAVVSDTHLASTHEKVKELSFFYKTVYNDFGITNIFHAGDLVAGINMYLGQENELKYWGSDNQVAYFVDNYPEIKGVRTYFITGNHDLCYLKTSGKDIGKDIENQRKDMTYLGQYLASIDMGGVNIELHHIDRGTSYAWSYPLQKTIESTPDEKKPDLLFAGHLHQKLWIEERGINAFLAACFEGQSLWLKRKKLYPAIGGFVIKIGLDAGKIRTITPTFIGCA